jgi:hypothetical protein
VSSYLSWTHVPAKWWYPPAVLLTSCMEQSSYWKVTGFTTRQEIPAAWNMKTGNHVDSWMPVSLSRATWIQPTPTCSVSVTSILIFSSHLCPILPHGLFPLCFPTKTLYAFLCALASQSHPAGYDYPNVWCGIRIMRPLISAMLHSVTGEKVQIWEMIIFQNLYYCSGTGLYFNILALSHIMEACWLLWLSVSLKLHLFHC